MQIGMWKKDNLHTEWSVNVRHERKYKNTEQITCLWLKKSTEMIPYKDSSGPTDMQ